MCGPSLFQLYMLVASLNTVVIICLLHGSAVDSAILRSHFCYCYGPKMDCESAFLLFFYHAVHAGPKNGTARLSHFRSVSTREAPTRLQKWYQFQVQKTNPKTSLLYLLVLIMTIFPFLLCWCKPAIERFEARRSLGEARRGQARPGRSQARPGEAWAKPRHGRKTYWHKDKARLMGTRNYIILLLKSQ